MRCYIFDQTDKIRSEVVVTIVAAENKEEAITLIHERYKDSYDTSFTPEGWNIEEFDITKKGCKEVLYCGC